MVRNQFCRSLLRVLVLAGTIGSAAASRDVVRGPRAAARVAVAASRRHSLFLAENVAERMRPVCGGSPSLNFFQLAPPFVLLKIPPTSSPFVAFGPEVKLQGVRWRP